MKRLTIITLMLFLLYGTTQIIDAREKCGSQEGRINFWNKTNANIDDFQADIRFKSSVTNRLFKSCPDAEGSIPENHNRFTKISTSNTACYINAVRVNGLWADISEFKNDSFEDNSAESCLAIENNGKGGYKLVRVTCTQLYGTRYGKNECQS